MNTFRLVGCKTFNVVAERLGGEPEVVNEQPLTWPEACREVQKQLKEGVLDVNIVVVGPRRPWSMETLGAYLRVLDGPPPATELLQRLRQQSETSREDLLLALTGINNDLLGVAQPSPIGDATTGR